MKSTLHRLWNSATLMTWMSYSTKALTLFAVLPLVLKKFSPGDIVMWYLFSTIIALQAIADFGFRSTFVRLISFAFGGAEAIGIFNPAKAPAAGTDASVSAAPNRTLLSRIVSAMMMIYRWLTLIAFVLLTVFGTWSMVKPVQGASNAHMAWISWLVVLFVSCAGFFGKVYLNFLEGVNKVALVRRVETLTSLGSILTSFIVLLFAPTLLNLVIANQAWVLAVVVRDYFLCTKTEAGLFRQLPKNLRVGRPFLREIWQPAWRSGVSGLMSSGLTNVTALVYAQMGNAPAVAAYLLAIRLLNQIREVSMAPFYSKIPVMARLRVHHKLDELRKLVQKGMLVSHLVFVTGFIITGLLIAPVLHAIHSKVHFIDQPLWILLGIAFFIHRFGAMHIQSYVTTNHVISHIADGISGLIYIVSTVLLVPYLHLYAVPVAMLIGYLGFFAWYAASHNYRSMLISAWSFEKKASLIPFNLFLAYVILIVSLKWRS